MPSATLATERDKPEDAIVSDVGSAWANMAPKWELTETLLGGTEAMRAAGERYLPRYPEEDIDNWDSRRDRSYLTNFFKKSLRTLSAKPFMRPLGIKDVDADLEYLLTDCDREGNSMHVFHHRGFRTGLAKGIAHILVDFPTTTPGSTLADQRKTGARPYLRHVAPENLLAGYASVVNGEERYEHVRILMQRIDRAASFGEVLVNEILVLEPGQNTLYQLVDEENEKWVIVDQYRTGIDFVPLVTYYADRTGFLESDPPLQDLAHLNVAHWQSNSDQTNVLTVARFPILGASGVTSISDSDQPAPKSFRIGPHQVLTANDPQSRIYFVEHTGAAIASGRDHLQDLKDEMALLGMELVMRGRGGRITATAHAIDKAEADTGLSQMAVDYEEAINLTLRYANGWMGKDINKSAGIAQLAADFGLSLRDVQEVRDLIDMRTNGQITQQSLLRELKRRAVLSDDFDIAVEIQELASEPRPTDTPGAPGTGSPSPAGGADPTLRAVQ